MSLLDSTEATPPASSTEAVYVLVHTTDEGWALIARHPESRCFEWTVLAARGASPTAPPRTAQAVAVRVLAGWGVAVRDWAEVHDEPQRPSGYRGGFRAVLAASPSSSRTPS